MTTKEKRFARRQVVRKALHERKRKAHRLDIAKRAIAEYDKFEVKGAENAKKVGAFLVLFRKMWRDVLRGRTAKIVAKREAKAKEMAKARKERNAKKNS